MKNARQNNKSSLSDDASVIWKPFGRATKLFRECKNLPYVERLKYLDLPTLRFKRCRGHMIETYKLFKLKTNMTTGMVGHQYSFPPMIVLDGMI